jgi:polysaccharide export outer membrane protein
MAVRLHKRRRMKHAALTFFAILFSIGVSAPTAAAQSAPAAARTTANIAAPPAGYVIGPDDVLSVVFWQDEQMTRDVVVRPDGRISLSLVNDVQAAGRTPEQLREALVEAAGKYIIDPNPTVIVKEMRSRKVFVMGNVGQAGPQQLTADMTVLQLLAVAGGLLEHADKEKIVIVRTAGGTTQHLKFNYDHVVRGRNTAQNVLLLPGDTVIVP